MHLLNPYALHHIPSHPKTNSLHQEDMAGEPTTEESHRSRQHQPNQQGPVKTSTNPWIIKYLTDRPQSVELRGCTVCQSSWAAAQMYLRGSYFHLSASYCIPFSITQSSGFYSFFVSSATHLGSNGKAGDSKKVTGKKNRGWLCDGTAVEPLQVVVQRRILHKLRKIIITASFYSVYFYSFFVIVN